MGRRAVPMTKEKRNELSSKEMYVIKTLTTELESKCT
jgi:hypothetical protein